ncbi:hypothetical protein MMC13_001185 [Lambiella insularis]|nr:hypothetical protein [Lambiella insularis]
MPNWLGQPESIQDAEDYANNFELYPQSHPFKGTPNDSDGAGSEVEGSIDQGHLAARGSRSSVSIQSSLPTLVWLRSLMSRSPLLRASSSGRAPSYSAVEDNGISTGAFPERDGTRKMGGLKSSHHSSLASGVGIPATEGNSLFEDIAPLLEDADEEDDNAILMQGDAFDEEDPPDNSPFAQVRASVSATDNITLSISTPRMWILSLLFALLGSAANLFFSLRYPSVAITPVIALVLVHPIGRAWDSILKRDDDPQESFEHGTIIKRSIPDETPGRNVSVLRQIRLWLAQGQWNEKEHACVYISSNVSFGFAFATDVIVEQTQFYHQEVSIVYQVLLTISTQVLGYAFAGLTRRYLVRPASMIWPGTLMSTAMFTTMHKSENKIANGWRITRWRFFILVWSAAFLWYFLPGLLVPALSYFSVVTWFAPKSVVLANLLLDYSNAFYSSFMPILSPLVFDNTGNPYDVTKVINSDFLFDRDAYEKYSPVYLPITYVLSYAVQFASLSALVTHTICWHGKDIWAQTKQMAVSPERTEASYRPVAQSDNDNGKGKRADTISRGSINSRSSNSIVRNGDDVHFRLMQRYEDAPASWYLLTFFSMLAIGIFVVE